MELNDYMARVEQAVRDNVHADILLVVEYEKTDRRDYWEYQYYVAWENEEQCGTHRVHINSKGESALFLGHHRLSAREAARDAIARTGLLD